jgi:hypothetical protein
MNKWKPNGITKEGMPPKKMSEGPEIVLFNTGGGGAGKIVMSTAVAKSIKEDYPYAKLYVITSYPLVYQSIKYVDRVYQAGANTQVYQILQDESHGHLLHLQSEPYFYQDYVNGKMHLIEGWHRQLELRARNRPNLQLTAIESHNAKGFIAGNCKSPTIALQITGGASCKDHVKNFERDLNIQTMQHVVNELSSDYGFIQILKDEQPKLEGVLHFDKYSLRECFSVIKNCHMVLTIDSMSLHIAKAFNKKTVALWAATRPQCLGYEDHLNLWREACPTPLCNRPNSFLADSAPDGSPWVCPYGVPCRDPDVQGIIDAVRGRMELKC